ncbi:MAG: type IV pilin protein [Gammaproteobacteria bacterium]
MSTSLNRIRTVSGFTLIEVMIVVAIVGILSAIAYPSYQQHVRSSRRADAQAALLELAQIMERRFTENNGYDLGLAGVVDAPDNLPFTQSPRDGTAVYNLTLLAVAANTFTLQAAPIAGGPQVGDGNMQLAETGAKFWDRTGDGDFGDTDEDCWRKYC